MSTDLTIGDLLKQGLVTEDDVHALIDAAVATPSAKRLDVGEAYALNLANFLRAHAFVGKTLRDPDASEGLKKAALRKSILKARLQMR